MLCRDQRLIRVFQWGILEHLSSVEAHGFRVLRDVEALGEVVCDREVTFRKAFVNAPVLWLDVDHVGRPVRLVLNVLFLADD